MLKGTCPDLNPARSRLHRLSSVLLQDQGTHTKLHLPLNQQFLDDYTPKPVVTDNKSSCLSEVAQSCISTRKSSTKTHTECTHLSPHSTCAIKYSRCHNPCHIHIEKLGEGNFSEPFENHHERQSSKSICIRIRSRQRCKLNSSFKLANESRIADQPAQCCCSQRVWTCLQCPPDDWS